MQEGEFRVAMRHELPMTAACGFLSLGWLGLTDVFRAAMEHSSASRSLASDSRNGPKKHIVPWHGTRKKTTCVAYVRQPLHHVEWRCSERPNRRLNATASLTPPCTTCRPLIRGSGRAAETQREVRFPPHIPHLAILRASLFGLSLAILSSTDHATASTSSYR